MGVINKGANGPFRGKAGSIIGSGWKKIDYIKGKPRPYKNKGKPSAAQSLQQQKFKLLTKFLTPTAKLLAIGFRSFIHKSTAKNAAFRYNYDRAFLLDGEELSLNYSAIKFSHGSLFPAGGEKAVLEGNQIKVTWNTKTYGLSGALDDEVFVYAYFEGLDTWISDEKIAFRYQGETAIEMDDDVKPGETIHIWLFLSDNQRKQVSQTTYLSLMK